MAGRKIHVRRDIWSLESTQSWHPIVDAYARAVDAMRQRDPQDPTSWAYQAAVHATRGPAPDEFRNQCQHGSWYFLPWHRMYLHWFEKMVQELVRTLPGIPDAVREHWALPYWDYGRRGPATDGRYRTLPPSFRRRTTPSGDPNPLFVPQRDPAVNAGGPLPELATSPDAALRDTDFSVDAQPGGTVGFGGPITTWHHSPPSPSGSLEATPHGAVHSLVGGPGGFMSAFDTAPLDPIFWLHHANIDRLWVVWLRQRRPERQNPTAKTWTDFEFDFHDETGAPVDPRPRPLDVVDTVELGYRYQRTTPPPAPRIPMGVTTMASRPPQPGPAAAPTPAHPPEMVGASDQPVQLTGRPARVAVPVAEPTGPVRASMAAPDQPNRVYLNIEGIEGEANPGTVYAVYVDLPDDDDEDTDPETHYVGTINFFGIEEAGDLDSDHPGGPGLRFAFDVTELVDELRDQGIWDPSQMTVTFAPLQPSPPPGGPALAAEAAEVAAGDEEAPSPPPPVRVGRVSIYYQ
jgi:tyrosinase